ncbi:MAG: M23 family metallopeptidase [Bacteroidales bacterium]|nr:MAG: M23 family metallopeptidase [Bacteroidales bacterium]
MGKSRKRYKYNYNSLTFEAIKITPGKKIFKSLFFIFILCCTSLFGYVAINSIGSPKELLLKKKTTELNNLIEYVNYQLDSISDVLTNNHFKDDNFYRTILEIDAIPKTIRDAGVGGSKKTEKINNLNKAGLVLLTAQKIDKLYRQINMQAESYEYLQDKADEKVKRIACIPSIMPLSVADLVFISSYYGTRIDPFYKHQKPHFGLDFVGPRGTKIYTTGDGIVTLSKYSRKGYGNEIIINHSFGYSSRYAHLDEIYVNVGEKVKRGQLIGTLGNTGRSTGPHLHYEIRYNHRPINPIYYYADEISSEEYERMLINSNLQ